MTTPTEQARQRRAEAKQKTREALIDAATELIASGGLDGPSLDAICERAGYTRGAFYVHFADREALVAAVMERAGEQLLGTLLPEGADLNQVIAGFVRLVLAGDYPLASERGIRPHQLYAACARSEALQAWYRRVTDTSIRRIREALGRSQTAGLVRADVDPQPVAPLLFALVLGAQTMIDLGLRLDLGSSAVALLQLLMPPSAAAPPSESASEATAPLERSSRRQKKRGT